MTTPTPAGIQIRHPYDQIKERTERSFFTPRWLSGVGLTDELETELHGRVWFEDPRQSIDEATIIMEMLKLYDLDQSHYPNHLNKVGVAHWHQWQIGLAQAMLSQPKKDK